MAWNLSGLIIISFFVNHCVTTLISDSNMSINLETPQADIIRQVIIISKVRHRGYLGEEK